MNSSAFRDQPKQDEPHKRDILFNGPGDGSAHGHVVQSQGPNGDPHYHYVRDVEGNEYINDRR